MLDLSITRQLLNATEGGLTIFKKYLKVDFAVNEMVTFGDFRFIVTWDKKHKDYIISIDLCENDRWIQIAHKQCAIWWLKEMNSFDALIDAIIMINTDMNLGLIIPKKVVLTAEQKRSSFNSLTRKVG